MSVLFCPRCRVALHRADGVPGWFNCPRCWGWFDIRISSDGPRVGLPDETPIFDLLDLVNGPAKLAALPRKRKAVKP